MENIQFILNYYLWEFNYLKKNGFVQNEHVRDSKPEEWDHQEFDPNEQRA